VEAETVAEVWVVEARAVVEKAAVERVAGTPEGAATPAVRTEVAGKEMETTAEADLVEGATAVVIVAGVAEEKEGLGLQAEVAVSVAVVEASAPTTECYTCQE
jgi:hypothetical protein